MPGDQTNETERRKPSYINEGAEPTPEIPEGGGIHAEVGVGEPYRVPTAQEVGQAVEDYEAQKAAAEEALRAEKDKEGEDVEGKTRTSQVLIPAPNRNLGSTVAPAPVPESGVEGENKGLDSTESNEAETASNS